MNNITVSCFLAVAHTNSFTLAAEQLFMSRQAVSSQVAQLERQLHTPLFLRTPTSIELTEAGQLCYRFFSDAQRSWQDFRSLAGRLPRSIFRIGCDFELDAEQVLSAPVQNLLQSYPDLEITFSNDISSNLMYHLANGLLDIALINTSCPNFTTNREKYFLLPLAHMSMTLLLNTQHPLQSDSPADYCGYPCYIWNDTAKTDEEFKVYYQKKLLQDYHLNFTNLVILPNRDSVFTTVLLSRGMTIIGSACNIAKSEHIRQLTLDKSVPLAAVWRKEKSVPFLDMFIDILKTIVHL